MTDHLDGYLAHPHPLSADAVATGLAAPVRTLFGNPAQDHGDRWEIETRQLPRGLRSLRRRARDFARTELAPLALEIDAAPHWPADAIPAVLHRLLVTAGRAGWLSDLLPKPIGSGSPRTVAHPLAMTASLKVEEFSRACGGLMLLLSAHMLGQVPLLLSADPLLIGRRLIPGVRRNLTGDPYLFAFAITEPDAGSDVEEGHGAALGHPGVVARRVTGGWLLNGRKVFISGGDIAQGFTLFAALDGEGYESWTCFFIERGSPGFRPVRTELKMGMRASGAAELELLDVFVPDADVVGKVRGGWSLNRQTLNISRIPVAAMAVGFAQAACDIAVDHVTRSDGGRARIHDQSVQLAVADMITATSAIRAQVWAAASGWRLRQSTGAMAKFYATDTAMGVIEQGMDLLGPDALLHHNGLEKVWRDCRLTQIFEGTNQINRLAVIEDLQYGFLEPSTTRSQP
jgi:butyryl-CoA dehydrogenase